MRVLFVISNSETAFWLSEVTHPYWHLTERGIEVDFASPQGGKVVFVLTAIRISRSPPNHRISSAKASYRTKHSKPSSTRR